MLKSEQHKTELKDRDVRQSDVVVSSSTGQRLTSVLTFAERTPLVSERLTTVLSPASTIELDDSVVLPPMLFETEEATQPAGKTNEQG